VLRAVLPPVLVSPCLIPPGPLVAALDHVVNIDAPDQGQFKELRTAPSALRLQTIAPKRPAEAGSARHHSTEMLTSR